MWPLLVGGWPLMAACLPPPVSSRTSTRPACAEPFLTKRAAIESVVQKALLFSGNAGHVCSNVSPPAGQLRLRCCPPLVAHSKTAQSTCRSGNAEFESFVTALSRSMHCLRCQSSCLDVQRHASPCCMRCRQRRRLQLLLQPADVLVQVRQGRAHLRTCPAGTESAAGWDGGILADLGGQQNRIKSQRYCTAIPAIDPLAAGLSALRVRQRRRRCRI